MNQDTRTFVNEEFPLQDYLLIILRKWWVIVSVTAASLLLIWIISSRQPDVFEARVKLLIVNPVSSQLFQNPEGGTSELNLHSGIRLSVDTLSSLATAKDLLQKVIASADLRDVNTGNPLAVEVLTRMMTPTVERANSDSSTSLPLLTMTVHTGDSMLAKTIATKWAEIFIQENSQLFSSEAALSHNFIADLFAENQKALMTIQTNKLEYEQSNPITSLQAQLTVANQQYKESLSNLQETRLALTIAKTEKAHFETTFETLGRVRSEKAAYERANKVDPLRTELTALTEQYQMFISNFNDEQAALVKEKTRMQSIETSLTQERSVINLKQSISNESLFEFLGSTWESDHLSVEQLTALGNLVGETEQLNPTYFDLKRQLTDTRNLSATGEAATKDLKTRTTELKNKIEGLIERIHEIELKVSEFDEQLVLLSDTSSGPLLHELSRSRTDVALFAPLILDLEQRTGELENLIQALNATIAQRLVTLSTFDREISALKNNEDELAGSLQVAQIIQAEEAVPIRVVESAVKPEIPIGPARGRLILLGTALGLAAGVGVAFVYHILQNSQASRRQTQTI